MEMDVEIAVSVESVPWTGFSQMPCGELGATGGQKGWQPGMGAGCGLRGEGGQLGPSGHITFVSLPV